MRKNKKEVRSEDGGREDVQEREQVGVRIIMTKEKKQEKNANNEKKKEWL